MLFTEANSMKKSTPVAMSLFDVRWGAFSHIYYSFWFSKFIICHIIWRYLNLWRENHLSQHWIMILSSDLSFILRMHIFLLFLNETALDMKNSFLVPSNLFKFLFNFQFLQYHLQCADQVFTWKNQHLLCFQKGFWNFFQNYARRVHGTRDL